jgi:4-azaleucine resistance transporter AzlC
MPFDRSAFLLGVREILPMLLGVIPFGLITGVSAVGVGVSPLDLVYMSLTVYAGASQIAALALLGSDASIGVIVLTVAMINLRHLMYSASLAPWFERYSLGTRSLVSFLLVDHAYALGITRYREAGDDFSRRDYHLGLGLTLWSSWVIASAVGAFLGAQVPPGWQLDFAVPLMFLALLMPNVRTRPALVAALTGGSLALLLSPLPFNLGLVVAALTGIALGAASETWWAGEGD